MSSQNSHRDRPARIAARFVSFAERHAGRVLVVALAVAVVASTLASRLSLHPDMAELLPDDHPAVTALRGVAGRQKASTNLIVLIDSPDGAATRRFAEALRAPLEALVPTLLSEVQWAPDAEVPAYAARWRWLYADAADLEKAEELLDRVVARRLSPLVVDLEGDAEAELRSLADRLEHRVAPDRALPHAFVANEGGRTLQGIMLWRRGGGLGTVGEHETLQAVRDIVARAQPTRFHPDLRVHYTGPIAMTVDEHNAVRDDLTLATTVCTLLVLLAIWLYFRRLALVAVVGAPALLGLVMALALAGLTVRYLNANTAFLISIILGNGINAPIVLLARYGEERRAGANVRDGLALALRGTLLATGTAMAAASIAYGSLLATSFRGFSQFGLLGGSGMLLVWLATFALVPPLILLGERWRPGSMIASPSLWRPPFAWFARFAERRSRLLGAVWLALLVAATFLLVRYLRDPMEWDFRNLRSAETASQRDWARMYRLGMGNVGAGHIGTDAVLLVDHPEQADAVARALRAQDGALGPQHILREVRTITSVLPDRQVQKLAVLGRIRAKIDRRIDLLDGPERATVERFRPPDDLRVVTVQDLPRTVRESFTEVDGTRGRLIGIDAEPRNFSDWNGHDLLRLSRALRVDALGKTWVAASTSTVFGGMVQTVRRDGPRVTALAFVGVVGLVLIVFRGAGAPVVVSLLVGLAWLGGALSVLGLKLNFVNFVAVPITLGIGADYAANIYARLRAEGKHRLATVIADTGSAVALCSATTIIGYGSLLLASNRALRSFGMVAGIGEVTCLVATLMVLPVVVRFAPWLASGAPRSGRRSQTLSADRPAPAPSATPDGGRPAQPATSAPPV